MGDFFLFCILSMTCQLLLTSGRKDFNLIIRQTQLRVAYSCCCRALCARYYLILYLRSMGRKKNKVSNAKNVKYINKSIFFLKTFNFQITIFLDAVLPNDFSNPLFIELDTTQVCT